ncbi:MAG: ABC transporter permease [Eubacteriales bacterium]
MKYRRTHLIYPILMTVLTYLPIVIVAVYSFNESKLSSQWTGFSLKWYAELFRDDSILEALGNSVFLGVVSSLLAAVIGTAAALGMNRSRLPLKRWVEKLALLPLIIPEIVLGMVFLAFFSLLGLPFGMLTLVIAHTAFCIPYVYTEVAACLGGLDISAIEAARDLGAGRLTAFFTVTLPMISPAVLSGMFFSFAMSFDDVIISIFVTGVSVNTLPIKVYTQIKTGLSPKINALCTIMLAVSILSLTLAWLLRRKR